MKIHHLLPLAALAIAGASHATTTDWGALGPTPSVAFVTGSGGGAVSDIFTFTLSGTSDVTANASEYEANSVSLPGATFTLYSGTPGSGTLEESAFSFNSDTIETTYSALAAGSYYFVVSAPSSGPYYAYDFEASLDNGNPPSDVPEPADAALLVAGLGMLAFVGGRRRQR